MIEKASIAFARDFASGPARHLFKPLSSASPYSNKTTEEDRKPDADGDSLAREEEDRLRRLARLYYVAGQTSGSLQAQLPLIEYIPQAEFLGERFQVSNPKTEAHRLHGLADATDRMMDGSPVALALNPLVRISGNGDGEGYGENRRVLVRTCVVLNAWAEEDEGGGEDAVQKDLHDSEDKDRMEEGA